jgi:hypothetical protein
MATGAAGFCSGLISKQWVQRPILKAGFTMGLVGVVAQGAYNILYDRLEREPDTSTFLQRAAKSKWIPLKSISDEEYKDIIQERLDNLDHHISSVERQIAALEQQKRLLPTSK